jgi:recombination protein RecT
MENNKIQKAAGAMQQSGGRKTLQQYVKAMEGEIAKALPSVMTPERFTRITLSAISTNPQLASCTPQSFLGAMMTAAQIGLEPNTPLGQCWLIPYRNHGELECQFQLGYKGLIDLAYKGGVVMIQAHTVYENDTFEYELGLESKLVHKPAEGERGKPRAYYATFKTKEGGYGFAVMSQREMEDYAKKYSKSYGSASSPWKTNFEQMAKKTVLKQALKYAPLNVEFTRAITSDETIKTKISEDMYAMPDETIYAEIQDVDVDEQTGEVVEGSEG